MEQLSRAYIHAVSAKANVRCVPDSPDVNDIDVELKADGEVVVGGKWSPRLEVQLKATASPQWVAGGELLAVRVPRRNYEGLRCDAAIPRLLMVLVLPGPEPKWLEVADDHLLSRKYMLWLNLLGLPPDEGSGEKVTVRVPRAQRVTPEAIWGTMERVARKEVV